MQCFILLSFCLGAGSSDEYSFYKNRYILKVWPREHALEDPMPKNGNYRGSYTCVIHMKLMKGAFGEFHIFHI